jgi:hypothetical protein
MLVEAGYDDARKVREELGLHSLLRSANCNLRALDDLSLRRLSELSDAGRTFVVKSHRGPTPLLRQLVGEGKFRVMYSYRDLRDVAMSGMDRAREMREKGELKGRQWGIGPQKSFGKLTSLPMAIVWLRMRVVPVWRAYTSWDEVLSVRYEDLSADTVAQMRRIRGHLGVDVPDEKLEEIAARYRREKIKPGEKGSGLHFNKGVSGRYRTSMSERQIRLCKRFLGKQLEQMGYSVE